MNRLLGQSVEIFKATRAGCVRQIWFVFLNNQLLIKTNNRQNRERLLWAIHCAVD